MSPETDGPQVDPDDQSDADSDADNDAPGAFVDDEDADEVPEPNEPA